MSFPETLSFEGTISVASESEKVAIKQVVGYEDRITSGGVEKDNPTTLGEQFNFWLKQLALNHIDSQIKFNASQAASIQSTISIQTPE